MDTEVSTDDYFPGSRIPIRHPNRSSQHNQPKMHTPKPLSMDDGWSDKPKEFIINGGPMDFFNIGQLARALGRKPVTIRLWEREGILPKATFMLNANSVNGRRRYYSKGQVEGIVRIALEEGILVSHQRPIKGTRFTERVVALFKELSSKQKE